MTVEDKPLVAIIDSDSLLYIACHNKKGEPEKSLEDCQKHLDSLIKDLFYKVGATQYLMYLTVGNCFRYEIFSEYKSKRTLEKPPYFNESRKYLLYEWKASATRKYEADDLCIMAHRYLADQGIPSIVISPDKDLVLCCEGNFYNPKKEVFIVNTKEEAELNFWKSMICGDQGDGIPGLKGRGPAFAAKVLAEGDVNTYSMLVFKAYVDYYKNELKAIEEFYMHYRLLKILEFQEGFFVSLQDVPKEEIATDLSTQTIEEIQLKTEASQLGLNFLL